MVDKNQKPSLHESISSVDLDVCEKETKPAFYVVSFLGPVGKGNWNPTVVQHHTPPTQKYHSGQSRRACIS